MENGPELKLVVRWSVQHNSKESKLNPESKIRIKDEYWKTLKTNLRVDVKVISRFIPSILRIDWKDELIKKKQLDWRD